MWVCILEHVHLTVHVYVCICVCTCRWLRGSGKSFLVEYIAVHACVFVLMCGYPYHCAFVCIFPCRICMCQCLYFGTRMCMRLYVCVRACITLFLVLVLLLFLLKLVRVPSTAGFDVTVFEQTGDIGGNWVFRETEAHASVYRSTVINTSKQMMSFSDYPMPNETPSFPHHSHIARWVGDHMQSMQCWLSAVFACCRRLLSVSARAYTLLWCWFVCLCMCVRMKKSARWMAIATRDKSNSTYLL